MNFFQRLEKARVLFQDWTYALMFEKLLAQHGDGIPSPTEIVRHMRPFCGPALEEAVKNLACIIRDFPDAWNVLRRGGYPSLLYTNDHKAPESTEVEMQFGHGGCKYGRSWHVLNLLLADTWRCELPLEGQNSSSEIIITTESLNDEVVATVLVPFSAVRFDRYQSRAGRPSFEVSMNCFIAHHADNPHNPQLPADAIWFLHRSQESALRQLDKWGQFYPIQHPFVFVFDRARHAIDGDGQIWWSIPVRTAAVMHLDLASIRKIGNKPTRAALIACVSTNSSTQKRYVPVHLWRGQRSFWDTDTLKNVVTGKLVEALRVIKAEIDAEQ